MPTGREDCQNSNNYMSLDQEQHRQAKYEIFTKHL